MRSDVRAVTDYDALASGVTCFRRILERIWLAACWGIFAQGMSTFLRCEPVISWVRYIRRTIDSPCAASLALSVRSVSNKWPWA